MSKYKIGDTVDLVVPERYKSNEWIKCSDKIPEKDGRYLVCVPYNISPPWIGVSSLRNGKFDDSTATYWMNLPSEPEMNAKDLYEKCKNHWTDSGK